MHPPQLLVLLKSYASCPYEVDSHVENANRWRRKSLLTDKNERLRVFLGYLMQCSREEVNRWCCYSPLPAGSSWNYCRGSVNHLQGPSVEALHQWPSSLALSCKVLYIKTRLPRQQVHVQDKGRKVTLEAPSTFSQTCITYQGLGGAAVYVGHWGNTSPTQETHLVFWTVGGNWRSGTAEVGPGTFSLRPMRLKIKET